MKRLIAPLALVALLAAGCGDDSEIVSADESATPTRIVSLSPSGTEMLFAIGAGDQVVAVDSFSYHPPEAPVTELSAYEPNIEAVADFEPDLVVLDFDPGDVVSGLDALGIASLQLTAAATFEDIYTQIEQVGAATGHIAEAAELVGQMQTDIATAVDSYARPDQPLTYYHELDSNLYTATSSTFVGQVYGLFGLTNVADAADADGAAFGYPQLSAEYLVDADPDIIFLANTLYEEQSLQTLGARPGWDALSAVENGNVVELDDDIVSRWGPRVVDFVEAVAEALESMTVGAS